MDRNFIAIPSREILIKHVVQSLSRYWNENTSLIEQLPIHEKTEVDIDGPLVLCEIPLPAWGVKYGVEGKLLVPAESCAESDGNNWEKVDWWLAIFILLECCHERAWEARHGPVHSFSTRLNGWDERAWQRAWVNRIALFLRLWAAKVENIDPDTIFGKKPEAEIVMTHDVDAIAKTWAIRIKQTAFLSFNAARQLSKGNIRQSINSLFKAGKFFFSNSDWWMVDKVTDIELQAGIKSQFNFYADRRNITPLKWLFDPGYHVTQTKLAKLIQRLKKEGFEIGLHQSYDAWKSSNIMRDQKELLESIVGDEVPNCRQHWLRFSWQDTWKAQSGAGIKHDLTLMFNDRPGFRSSAAINWMPWDFNEGRVHQLFSTPTIIMDSHFYDYQLMTDDERRSSIKYWADEIKTVGGQCAVLWHPHTLTSDYNWNDGFHELVSNIQ